MNLYTILRCNLYNCYKLHLQYFQPLDLLSTEIKKLSVGGWNSKDIWSGPDDAIYILDRDAERVVILRSGEAEVVKGTIRLERPCGVAVEGPDRAVYAPWKPAGSWVRPNHQLQGDF